MKMTLLHTQKARKRYPWPKAEADEAPESFPPFLRWYCNAVTVNKRPSLLMVHEGSLFSCLLYPFHSEDVRTIIERFTHSLANVLPNESTRENFALLRPLITGYTTQSAHDKSSLGSMVEIRLRMNWHLPHYPVLDDRALADMGSHINDNPWVQRGFFSDREFTKQLHEFVSSHALHRG